MAKGLGVLHPGDIMTRPDFVQAFVLGTGSSNAAYFDTPTGMSFAFFSYNADVWVTYGATSCNIPATTTTAGSSSPELNPTGRNMVSTANTSGLCIASEFACKGSLAWFTK